MPRLLKPNALLDTILKEQQLKNDAALTRALQLTPSAISKIRGGTNVVSAEIMISLHEKYGMPIARIKSLAGQA